jgi:hypothetical protein
MASFGHFDQYLTNVVIGEPEQIFVADDVYPTINVDHLTDNYATFLGGEEFNLEENRVGEFAPAREVRRSDSYGTFNAIRRGFKEFIPAGRVRNSEEAIRRELEKAVLTSRLAKLEREDFAAARATNTSIVTQNSTLSGTTQWSHASSAPLTAIATAQATVKTNGHMVATHMLISYTSALTVGEHASIKDALKYTSTAALTQAGLPGIVKGLSIIESAAIKNSANPGQTATLGEVWGDNALIFARSPFPYDGVRTFGATFMAPEAETGQRGMVIRRWPEKDPPGEWVEASMTYDTKEISAACAYLYKDLIA